MRRVVSKTSFLCYLHVYREAMICFFWFVFWFAHSMHNKMNLLNNITVVSLRYVLMSVTTVNSYVRYIIFQFPNSRTPLEYTKLIKL